jgi:hypothetical protein
MAVGVRQACRISGPENNFESSSVANIDHRCSDGFTRTTKWIIPALAPNVGERGGCGGWNQNTYIHSNTASKVKLTRTKWPLWLP